MPVTVVEAPLGDAYEGVDKSPNNSGMSFTNSLVHRFRAAGSHLAISALAAALVAAVVFIIWYPGPYRKMSGGQSLFLLVVSVDVVLGPVLTFVAFDVAKGWKHLRRDLAVIASLQLAALAYGIHTVYVVRPIAVVYETDRFRVVSAGDVQVEELPKAPEGYRQLPINGPWELAVRNADAGKERNEAIFLALQGFDTSQRPSFWLAYDGAVAASAYERARSVNLLMEHHAAQAAMIRSALKRAGIGINEARFVPVIARGDWVAILDRVGSIRTYLPVDGFF